MEKESKKIMIKVILFFLLICSTQGWSWNPFKWRKKTTTTTTTEETTPGNDSSPTPYDNLRDLKATMADMVKKSTHDIARIRHIDANSRHDLAFEIGHIYCLIFDKYRMMVSRYNQSMSMTHQEILEMELMLNLDTVASLYFEIVHLKGMMREVERKYAFDAFVKGDYDLIATLKTSSEESEETPKYTGTGVTSTASKTKRKRPSFFQRPNRTKMPSKVKKQQDRYTKDWKKDQKTNQYWPNHTYGWEPLYWDLLEGHL